MKTLIVSLNSKYIHSSLAPWYLKAYCHNKEYGKAHWEIEVLEYTINDSMDLILEKIYSKKAEIIAFSCYIWNIGQVFMLSENLKKMSPDACIILGGPEVSYDGEEILRKRRYIDFIISGEGEESFYKLLGYLKEGSYDLSQISGVSYRDGDRILLNKSPECLIDLDSLPSPYSKEMLESIGKRIVYYESSRGCPFSCSYCLSSISQGVRNFSLERVKEDLDVLAASGVKQIKFVDRTFNSNKSRARAIFSHIIKRFGNINTQINFHFETAADLFDELTLSVLKEAPKGLIQLEIGLQTTNLKTLDEISRKTSLGDLFSNVKKLKSPGNIHLHLDLIAGLPYEDFDSFGSSFNDVYGLRPHQLQLGFLKLLKGTRVRKEAEKHSYVFRDYPPYEILFNKYIKADEVFELKGIEELVERYYNSSRYVCTLDYALDMLFKTPFEFYRRLNGYFIEKDLHGRSLSSRECYNILFEFLESLAETSQIKIIKELMLFDFLRSDNTGNFPSFLQRDYDGSFRDLCFGFLKRGENIKKFLPRFQGLAPKQIYKKIHFEKFSFKIHDFLSNKTIGSKEMVVIFDYSLKSKVTGLYDYSYIDFKEDFHEQE